jgi:transposase
MADQIQKKTRTKSPEVTPAAFVTAWQKGESVAKVAAELGLSPRTAQQRAVSYRKKGVQLKKFGRTPDKLDVEALNKLAAELAQ